MALFFLCATEATGDEVRDLLVRATDARQARQVASRAAAERRLNGWSDPQVLLDEGQSVIEELADGGAPAVIVSFAPGI